MFFSLSHENGDCWVISSQCNHLKTDFVNDFLVWVALESDKWASHRFPSNAWPACIIRNGNRYVSCQWQILIPVYRFHQWQSVYMVIIYHCYRIMISDFCMLYKKYFTFKPLTSPSETMQRTTYTTLVWMQRHYDIQQFTNAIKHSHISAGNCKAALFIPCYKHNVFFLVIL